MMGVFLVSCLIMTPQTVKATVTIIQPSSADASLLLQYPDLNFGAVAFLYVMSGPGIDVRHGLVKFDLSSIPSGSTIKTAFLKLRYYYKEGDPEGRTYTAYRVTKNWVEMQATWNSYETGSPWANAGGDFSTDGASSSTVPSDPAWMTWEVTSIVKTWIEGGQPNYGFLIRDPNEDQQTEDAGVYFLDNKYGGGAPILEIDWSTPPVGGVIAQVDKLAVLTPYIALAGLIATASTIYIIKKRKD